MSGLPSESSLSTLTTTQRIGSPPRGRTKLFRETTVASSSEEARTSSSSPIRSHGNRKYVFPFWKTCAACSRPFVCLNRCQVARNRTCGEVECKRAVRKPAVKKHASERVGMLQIECAVCGEEIWRPRSHVLRVERPTCSRRCNGTLRGAEWAKHGHKGSSGVTPEGRASAIAKMTGASNPAWKGGVTVFKKHGNYAGVRYVRCPSEFLAMARRDGYVMEHRLVVARALGRCLLRRETVHHEDHNPKNNDIANLSLFRTNREHKLYEHRGSPEPIWRGSNPSTCAA